MKKAVRAIIVHSGKLLLMHRNKFGNEYYTLIGGGVNIGESTDDALVREVREETGLKVTSARLVFVEEAGRPYGTQHVYLCEVEGDEPRISPDADEAQINQLGQNLYTPVLVEPKEFPGLTFRSPLLQHAVVLGLKYGFPEQPVILDAQLMHQVQSKVATK